MYIGQGTLIENRYLIKKEIGQGGIGVIYLAYHVPLKKNVVVKKAARGTKNDYRTEVDILKNLHYPGIPQVYDFLEIDGYVYTVMEYVEGHDLSYYIRNSIHIPEKYLLDWIERLTEILDYIHTLDTPYYHSDIKPGNIMITGKGEPFLIDFNISVSSGEKRIKGISPYYSAPEQHKQAESIMLYHDDGGIVVDHRADIYSLGASFYTLMCGRLPGVTEEDTVPLTLMDLPYSMAFRALIDKAMREDPKKRFQSAAAMLKSIRNIVVMDPEYHRLTNMQIFLTVPFALFLIIGIILVLSGTNLSRQEKYNTIWSEYVLRYQENNYDAALDIGYELLRDSEMSALMDKDPRRKTELCHSIGDIYFDKEMYSAAADYYDDAADLSKSADAYRDLAVASARSGDIDTAYYAIEMAKEEGLDYETEQYIKAEILTLQKNYSEAEDILESVLENATDEDLKNRSSLLLAEAYRQDNNVKRAKEVLRGIISEQDNKYALRMLAQLNMDSAAVERSPSRGRSDIGEACSCYERLCNMYNPSYEDRINYALCLRYLEQYTQSNEVLDDILSIFERDSRAEMWKCYNLISLSRDNSTATNADLKEEYERLKQDYPVNGSNDMKEDMETLERIIGR